jgi:hypothetical protein
MSTSNETAPEIVDATVEPVADVELSATPMLLAGRSPGEVIKTAAEIADELRAVVAKQGLSQNIKDREHILIEGWQTLGAFVGVFAIRDSGVIQLPWPELAELPAEEPPPRSGKARENFERLRDLHAARDSGLAFGFACSWRAVKGSQVVGWGEGRCTRAEKTWATRDDYALAGMAQTRGQSRTLAAPLRFIAKLAGYATTPADEADGGPAGPAYGVGVDEASERDVARDIQAMHPGIDGPTFVKFVNDQFGTDRLPEASARMVAAIKWALGAESMHGNEKGADDD